MNRQEHLIICTFAFAGYAYFVNLLVKISLDNIAIAFFLALIGTILPDILEPPTSWEHRGIAHSLGALKFFGISLIITALMGLLSYIFYIASGFFLGYFVHLLIDSITPAGLPD